ITRRARSRERHDGARHRLADFAENILRRDAQLAMSGCAFEEILGRFLVEETRVDRAVVQLTERKQRRQRDAPVAAFEWTVDEEREEERRHFVGKRCVRFAAEHGYLRPLHGIQQAKLRLDDTGMRLIAAELDADGA